LLLDAIPDEVGLIVERAIWVGKELFNFIMQNVVELEVDDVLLSHLRNKIVSLSFICFSIHSLATLLNRRINKNFTKNTLRACAKSALGDAGGE
jgi:hypothetical protein